MFFWSPWLLLVSIFSVCVYHSVHYIMLTGWNWSSFDWLILSRIKFSKFCSQKWFCLFFWNIKMISPNSRFLNWWIYLQYLWVNMEGFFSILKWSPLKWSSWISWVLSVVSGYQVQPWWIGFIDWKISVCMEGIFMLIIASSLSPRANASITEKNK